MFTQQLMTYLEQLFAMPVLPASVLLCVIIAYGCLVLLGALDLDMIDVDFDIDADSDLDAVSSAGFVTLRFLNLADIPIMVWLVIFGWAWWSLSQVLWLLWDHDSPDPNMVLLVVRNIAASAIVTKFLTAPLVGIFASPPDLRPEDLIGKECEITTYQATTEFGQARFDTEAAPLILDVQTLEGELSKGQKAIIVDYDPETKTHLLEASSDPP